MKIVEKALDLLFPRICETCSRPVDRSTGSICSECLMNMPFLPVDGCCRVCSRPVEGYRGEYLCDDCSGRDAPCFDRAVQSARFEGEVRRLVLEYKFRDRVHLAADFAEWIEAAARARLNLAAVDVIVPVPLAFAGRFVRGYSQTELLAHRLSRSISRRMACALKRTGSPARQSTLGERERRKNVVGTFEVVEPALVRGRTVLVVDDIMTTGATLSECARVLKAAGGAARVWCVAIARSARQRPERRGGPGHLPTNGRK